MSAEEELVAYGYLPEDGEFVRRKAGKPTNKYVPVEGGFHLFRREDGQWVQAFYKIAPAFEGVSGLDFDKHPECFDVLFPREFVEAEYGAGNIARRAQEEEASARKRQAHKEG